MGQRIFRITAIVSSFLISYFLIMFVASKLPSPWNVVTMVAIFAGCLFEAIFILDMTLPFFNVLNPIPVRLPAHLQNAVCLTFDDGPCDPYTLEILDVLDRFKVKATFFCIGENIEKHPEIAAQISKRGHAIGNHSFGHAILPFLSKDKIIHQISETSQSIQKITGKKEKWFRFPKGYQSRKGLKIAESLGLKAIGFSYPIYDVENPPARELVKRTLGKVKSGDILLMHDGYPSFKPGQRNSLVEALPSIIQGIKDKNLRFVTLEEAFN